MSNVYENIAQFSSCDVSDALLTIKVNGAGHLADIHPFPNHKGQRRLVAPISTVLFVPKDFGTTHIPQESNLPSDRHWTDVAPAGSVAIMQLWNPQGQSEIVSGLLGDIVATRYRCRGVQGVVVDGRSRDVTGVNRLCEDGDFTAWTRQITSVGTGMEAKPWAVDVPLHIGQVEIKPGDIAHCDEGERTIVVIPQEKVEEVSILLPRLKQADDAVLADVESGMDLKTSFGAHPDHYTHFH